MNRERFEELYERYGDGELSAAERAEFVEAMEDAAWRALFTEWSSFEAAVAEELRVGRAELDGAGDRKPSSRTLPRMSPRRLAMVHRSRDRVAGWQIGAAVAAAALVAVAILAATLSRSPEPRTVERPMAEKIRTPEVAPPPPPAPPQPRIIVPEPRPEAPPEPPTPNPAPPRIEPDPVPAPRRAPLAPPPPAPKPEAPARESVAFIAQLERISGDVRVAGERAEAGRGIQSGQAVSTGPGAGAAVKFSDGSRLDLAADTVLGRISEGPAGKQLALDQGLLGVDAVKQGAGRPMTVATAHAEATVLGTQFTLFATPAYTRLDVKEGRVRFTRLPQAVTSVVVNAGHYAIAGAGHEFAAKSGWTIWKAPAQGLMLWLRADAGVKTSGTSVTAWMDQSGMNNHAAPPIAAAQPALVWTAGKPSVRFDGADDGLSLPAGFSDFRAGLSAFVVCRPAAGGAWTRFLDFDAGPQCDNICFGRKDAPDKLAFWVYANDQTKGKVEAAGTVVPDQLQSFSVVLGGQGRVTLFKGGAPVATGQTSTPASVVRKPNSIAKTNSGAGDPYYRGDLCEIFLYNRALSEPERAYVEAYLTAKYFDPTAPPPPAGEK